MRNSLLLAIETSCDETSCAVIKGEGESVTVLSNIVATQIEEHKLYGGVVPEIASRRHCESITGVCGEALESAGVSLKEIDGVAVTHAPGLIGALLVGVNFAKGIAMSYRLPLIPVHHIKAHIASNYISHPDLKPPFLATVVSGGHTSLIHVKGYTDFNVIGTTLDDAAGEAFDKVARAMDLPYPGGVHIDKAAKNGDTSKYTLPFPKTENKHDFSFSGLKTACINLLHNSKQSELSKLSKQSKLPKLTGKQISMHDLAASFQHTVCEILTNKTLSAADQLGINTIAVSGGVSANSHLREMLTLECGKKGHSLYFPTMEYCGDNAAMVGCQGYHEFLAGNIADSSLNAFATMGL